MRRWMGLLLTGMCVWNVTVRAERLPWMPPEVDSGGLRSQGSNAPQIIPDIIETKTPKPTASIGRYTRIYNLDLKKFGIRNNGTDAEATSKGINAALQHAKTLNINRIVFPNGTYLVHEEIPIVFDLKNTIVDLNGAVLQMRTNGKTRYKVVEIHREAENFRLTNGEIRGDRDTHDRKSVRSSFEGCSVMRVISGTNLEFDHLTITKALGSGMTVSAMGNRNRPELLAMIMASVYVRDFEPGGFTRRGVKAANTERMRTRTPFDATKCKGEFEFGLAGVGYQGYPHIKARVYQVYFYDDNMNFLEMKQALQYKRVQVPQRAKHMYFEINQAAFESESKALAARITRSTPPTDVHVHHCRFVENRSLGLALTGGQKWLLENNRFEKNWPDIVGWGIDIEDGWELTQHIIFRNNVFRGNLRGDFVICCGSEMIFEGNRFESNVAVYGRPHNYIFRHNTFTGGRVGYCTRTGIAQIHDNTYENCSLSITFDTKAVADGIYRKPGTTVATPPLELKNETLVNVSKVTGTYFNFSNAAIKNTHFIAGKETGLLTFQKCSFVDSSVLYEADGPPVTVGIKQCRGTLDESGPGLTRKNGQRSTR